MNAIYDDKIQLLPENVFINCMKTIAFCCHKLYLVAINCILLCYRNLLDLRLISSSPLNASFRPKDGTRNRKRKTYELKRESGTGLAAN